MRKYLATLLHARSEQRPTLRFFSSPLKGSFVKKLQDHWNKNKKFYIGVSVGLGVAGITYAIMKPNSKYRIQGESIALAQGESIALGTNSALTLVSYFEANRQGPPSWVVRCLETGDVFTSQKKAAEAMAISASLLSQHLNGRQDHVDGYHFERLCMAA